MLEGARKALVDFGGYACWKERGSALGLGCTRPIREEARGLCRSVCAEVIRPRRNYIEDRKGEERVRVSRDVREWRREWVT